MSLICWREHINLPRQERYDKIKRQDLLQDLKIISTQEISGNLGMLGSSGKKTALGGVEFAGREPEMFLYDKTQPLAKLNLCRCQSISGVPNWQGLLDRL